MAMATALRTSCKKIRYRDHREAVKVLHKIEGQRRRVEALGLPTRRREIRDYRCDTCKGFYLTSWAA
jgi:hypothetical protein